MVCFLAKLAGLQILSEKDAVGCQIFFFFLIFV